MSTLFLSLIAAAIAGPGQQVDDLSGSDPLFSQVDDPVGALPGVCSISEPVQICSSPKIRDVVEIDCQPAFGPSRTAQEQREHAQAQLDTVKDGDVIKLMSDCDIDHGLFFGPGFGSPEPRLSCILFDGNGHTIRATDDMTTVGWDTDGLEQLRCLMHNSYFDGKKLMCKDGFDLLAARGIDNLVIRDLTLDGNRGEAADDGSGSGRLNYWADISQTAMYANSGNLFLNMVKNATVWNVHSQNAYAHGIRVSGDNDHETRDLRIECVHEENSGCSNIVLEHCTECEITENVLEGGVQHLDIEPDNSNKLVKDVTVTGNTMADSRGRAFGISRNDADTENGCSIEGRSTTTCDITLEDNYISGSNTEKRTDPGFVADVSVGGVSLIGNTFTDIDASDVEAQVQLFKFHGAQNLTVEGNLFDQIYWRNEDDDGRQNSMLYFKDGAFEDGTLIEALPKTTVTSNGVGSVSRYPDEAWGWCFYSGCTDADGDGEYDCPDPLTFYDNTLVYEGIPLPDCSVPFLDPGVGGTAADVSDPPVSP